MPAPKPAIVKLDHKVIGESAHNLNSNMRRLIIGQDEAIKNIVEVYQKFLVGLSSPGRPIGNFLFLGPTGTGKTRVTEAVAEILLGNSRALIKIDCAEFAHSHEIAKLIGSPPGYLGHRETLPRLSQEKINSFHTDSVKLSFLLFDEIEKASDALWNMLLGILDKGILTMGDNRTTDFSQSMIFLTSNLGVQAMSNLLSPKLGFAASEIKEKFAGATGIDSGTLLNLDKAGLNAAKKHFTPEFVNRLDKIVTFHPLNMGHMEKILELELEHIQSRLFSNSLPLLIHCTQKAKEFILEKGVSIEYGARNLKRILETEIVQPLSNLIASRQVVDGDYIHIGFDTRANELVFLKKTGKNRYNTTPPINNTDGK